MSDKASELPFRLLPDRLKQTKFKVKHELKPQAEPEPSPEPESPKDDMFIRDDKFNGGFLSVYWLLRRIKDLEMREWQGWDGIEDIVERLTPDQRNSSRLMLQATINHLSEWLWLVDKVCVKHGEPEYVEEWEDNPFY